MHQARALDLGYPALSTGDYRVEATINVIV